MHVYNSKLFTLKVKYTTYQCSALTTVLSICKQIMASNLHVIRSTVMLGKIYIHSRLHARMLARTHCNLLLKQPICLHDTFQIIKLKATQSSTGMVLNYVNNTTQGSQSTLFGLH